MWFSFDGYEQGFYHLVEGFYHLVEEVKLKDTIANKCETLARGIAA